MKEKLILSFEAEDGTMFDTKQKCVKYEAELAIRAEYTTYWRITCNPDLTEGRGWYGCLLVECYIKGSRTLDELMMQDYCYRRFGRPIAFIQGCEVTANWILRQTDAKEYNAGNPIQLFGDYRHEGTCIKLVMGKDGQGLVEVEIQ